MTAENGPFPPGRTMLGIAGGEYPGELARAFS